MVQSIVTLASVAAMLVAVCVALLEIDRAFRRVSVALNRCEPTRVIVGEFVFLAFVIAVDGALCALLYWALPF